MIKIDTKLIAFLRKREFAFGLSGGCDSIAAAHFLHEKMHLRNMICVYVDHGLDSNSDQWKDVCKEFCSIHEIPFVSKKISVGNKNIECEARLKRYQAISEVSRYIVTAHHADDYMENVLLGLVRKKYLLSWQLNAFKEFSNYVIIRPFLKTTKNDFISYCHQNNLKYVVDSSNFDTSFDRNYIRKFLQVFKKRFKSLTHSHEIIDIIETAQKCCEDLAEIDIEKAFLIEKDLVLIDMKYFRNYGKHRLKNALIHFCRKNNIHVNKDNLYKITNQIDRQDLVSFVSNYCTKIHEDYNTDLKES